MDAAKIRLSQQEMEMVSDAGIILTKNRILEKIKSFLEIQYTRFETDSKRILNPHSKLLKYHGKISRGENYRGLPYLVLDFPRLFLKDDILAIRTMFWWGNYFSITFHIAGASKKALETVIENSYELIAARGFYVCVSANEWDHHFEHDNYQQVSYMERDTFISTIRRGNFIKIARKYPMDDWEWLAGQLAGDHQWLLKLASIRRPGDEKGL